MKRTDIHRPSVINPAEYVMVGVEYCNVNEDIGAVFFLAEQRRIIAAHMAATGGTYSGHVHGGNCHVCGAHCIYTVLFYHQASNSYIRTGFDCAEKMHMGDDRLFRSAKAAVKEARELKAGKLKASLLLEEAGCPEAWTVFNWTAEETAAAGLVESDGSHAFCVRTLRDIVGKLVKYGSVSDKQMAFVKKLAGECLNFAEVKAAKEAAIAAERAAGQPVPVSSERIAIVGEVVSIKFDDSWKKWNMLVRDDRGFKVWGSLPSGLDSDSVGLRISFMAAVTRSNKDEYFGFFKRPTQVEVEADAEVAAV